MFLDPKTVTDLQAGLKADCWAFLPELILCGAIVLMLGAMPMALRGHGGAPTPTQNGGTGTRLQPAADAPVPSNIVRQGFPAAGYDPEDVTKSESAWEVEWELRGRIEGVIWGKPDTFAQKGDARAQGGMPLRDDI